ncbi:hypothetical protein TYRP_001848 [Tyrophagus putrescentiae]|nr:hypothetical protein TYRP_001848 [Tyrophagus putrescentiae]
MRCLSSWSMRRLIAFETWSNFSAINSRTQATNLAISPAPRSMARWPGAARWSWEPCSPERCAGQHQVLSSIRLQMPLTISSTNKGFLFHIFKSSNVTGDFENALCHDVLKIDDEKRTKRRSVHFFACPCFYFCFDFGFCCDFGFGYGLDCEDADYVPCGHSLDTSRSVRLVDQAFSKLSRNQMGSFFGCVNCSSLGLTNIFDC